MRHIVFVVLTAVLSVGVMWAVSTALNNLPSEWPEEFEPQSESVMQKINSIKAMLKIQEESKGKHLDSETEMHMRRRLTELEGGK